MRRYLWVGGFAGLLLLGCSNDSQPRAKRGSPDKSGNQEQFQHEFQGAQTAKFDDAGGEVRLDNLTLTAPKGWPRKPPQSNFIQAEYVLPKAEGDSRDGRLTLSVVGGSLEDNIERWKGQFGGKPDKSHQEKIEVNGLAVTLVDLIGEFNDQPGPFAPGVKRADYRMIAAVIPVAGQLHFVKAVGPKRTLESHADKIQGFIRSVRK